MQGTYFVYILNVLVELEEIEIANFHIESFVFFSKTRFNLTQLLNVFRKHFVMFLIKGPYKIADKKELQNDIELWNM